MFTYPALYTKLPITWTVPMTGIVTATSPAGQLSAGTHAAYGGMELLTGMIPGPIAGTGLIVLAAAALYLFVRHSTFPMVTGPYVLTCAVLAMLFPRTTGAWYVSVISELSAGYLLFAGLFLLNSCITPRSRTGRAVYGILAGCTVMLLRHVGQFEEGTCFAVLLVNAFAPRLDHICWRVRALARRLWERRSRRGRAV
jgi:electron transport complex protein RnfD